MMFGYSDEWWVVLFIPVVLWLYFGVFVMAALGVWCARRPGLWPRLLSWLLPALPVGVLGTAMVLPLESVGRERWLEDFLGFLAVYVGGITLLPWLLGYGITRLIRAVRARRRRAGPGGRAAPGGPGESGGPAAVDAV
ncbi:hypothetical protein [Streptomyces sp. NPDC091371]|uniref:hypothetical protein n=1 Tax=Streptomyces sp. NPDC091371 TaxID=3155303 RepID=UPI00341A2B2C